MTTLIFTFAAGLLVGAILTLLVAGGWAWRAMDPRD